MMDLVMLLSGLTALLVVVRKMVAIELKGIPTDIGNEVKHNTLTLLWGIGILSLLFFIPYQAWKLAGSSLEWDGILVLGLSLIGSVLFSSFSYYFLKGRQLRSQMPSL